MAYYRQVGEIPRKRHTQFRKPDGGLYAEELMGVEGFSADSALLYHRYLPTAIVNAETVKDERGSASPNLPLKPRHFKTQDLTWASDDVDAVTGRRTLFGNPDVTIGFVVASVPSPLYRNAFGDELLYVQGGSGVIETIFVETEDKIVNKMGIKGIGEVGIVGVAAAIANAVFNATGRRVRELPITPDKLL